MATAGWAREGGGSEGDHGAGWARAASATATVAARAGGEGGGGLWTPNKRYLECKAYTFTLYKCARLARSSALPNRI